MQISVIITRPSVYVSIPFFLSFRHMQAKLKCRLSLNKAKSEPGSGRALLLQSKAQEILGDISMCMPNILSTCSLVYLIRPTSLPTYSGTGRIYFSHFWNSYPTFPGRVHDLYGPLYTVLGRPYGGFPDFGYLDPCRTELHIFALELKVVILALHH